MSKASLRLLVEVVTGHGLFSAHIRKFHKIDDSCSFCHKDKNTPAHLFFDCPELVEEREQTQMIAEYTNETFEESVLSFFHSPPLVHERILLSKLLKELKNK